MEKIIEWVKTHKPHTALISIAIVAIIAVSVAAATGAFTPQTPRDKSATTATDKAPGETVDVTLNVTADKGWDENSTPAIVHVEGEGEDFCHAVAPTKDNSGTYEVALEAGTYEVSVISPVNSDGSAYELFDTGKAQTLEVRADAENTVEMRMTLITADKVTDDMLKAIVADTETAIAKGDDSLKGDNGKAILETLDKNIKANPNATDETKSEADKAKDDSALNEAPAETPADKASNGNDKPADNSSNASANSGNSSASQHVHSWKNHTATQQVWVSNIVPVYETQTVQVGTQTVSDGWYWHCSGCGADVPFSEQESHAVAHVEAGEMSNGYDIEKTHEEPIYETQRVQVGTEDQGHYETQSYVDYQYCDCGATK